MVTFDRDDSPANRYDIRQATLAAEARLRSRSLAPVYISKADVRMLAAAGICWDDKENDDDER